MAKPSLLFLAHEFPMPISNPRRLRTFNWILHFSREFEITLLAPCDRRDAYHREALAAYCKEIIQPCTKRRRDVFRRFFQRTAGKLEHLLAGVPQAAFHLQNGTVRRALEHAATHTSFDVVFVDHWMWGSQALEVGNVSVLEWERPGWINDNSRPRSTHGLRERLRRRSRQAYLRQAYETLAHAGIVLVPNAETKLEVQDKTQRRARVVIMPSGMNTSFFAPRKSAKDPRKIAFLGPLHTATQRDALFHLYENLLPRLERRIGPVRLTVVDAEPVPGLPSKMLKSPRVEFTGRLEDVRSALWRSGCAVLPLRLGRGARDRLAQLLSMGIPTVVTPLAAQSMGIASGDGAIIAPEGADFVEAMAQVLTDPTLRRDLAERGREKALLQLSMEATYERLTDVLREAARQLQSTSS